MIDSNGIEQRDDTGNNKEVEVAKDGNTLKPRMFDWMLKPCEVYLIEFKDCKSFGARFYQNFYYGEASNCSQWKIDYDNCKKWKTRDDDLAYDELLASEKNRRLDRLKPHMMNDVWKRRDAPPSDWNEPLPDWMMKRTASTFLAAKQKECEETGKYSTIDSYAPSCTIA